MFITFEGPEGSGKSTQIALLFDFLRAQGREVVRTREPGGTGIGDKIRHILHDVANDALCPEAEILLYSASRAQLVNQLIRPKQASGQIILCDRFYDSTYAYQGYGRGLSLPHLRDITQFATGGLRPDVTILLDLPVERGLERRRNNDEEMNRMDLQELAFHQRVREGYHQLAQEEPTRWVIVDADRPISTIQADLRHILFPS